MLANGTTTINGGLDNVTVATKRRGKRNREVIFKNCTQSIE